MFSWPSIQSSRAWFYLAGIFLILVLLNVQYFSRREPLTGFDENTQKGHISNPKKHDGQSVKTNHISQDETTSEDTLYYITSSLAYEELQDLTSEITSEVTPEITTTVTAREEQEIEVEGLEEETASIGKEIIKTPPESNLKQKEFTTEKSGGRNVEESKSKTTKDTEDGVVTENYTTSPKPFSGKSSLKDEELQDLLVTSEITMTVTAREEKEIEGESLEEETASLGKKKTKTSPERNSKYKEFTTEKSRGRNVEERKSKTAEDTEDGVVTVNNTTSPKPSSKKSSSTDEEFQDLQSTSDVTTTSPTKSYT